MILTQNVHKTFGTTQALQNISFEIDEGEIVGFLGENGAGKTTLMRILTGYLSPTSGSVWVNGKDLSRNSLLARRNIGYLPETPPLYEGMRVREYLKFAAQLRDVPRQRIVLEIDRVLGECDLKNVQSRPIGVLSKGYRQRVGIAQAIIHQPSILILDEPTNGLDPVQVQQVRRLIKNLGGQCTVLVSTHILPEIEQLAQRILIIKEGRIVADQPLAALMADYAPRGQKTLEQIFLSVVGSPPKAV